MKVPVSWLREYFTAALDPQAAAERLTLSGIEVDSFQPIGALDPKVVAAEILEVSELKPGIARVQLRADRVRSLVTNAPGLQQGRKVAIALPGATLFAEDGSGLEEVREAEVFGGVSEAKVVNAAALGLGENHSDPVFLPNDAPVGTPFVTLRGEAAAVGGDEVLLLAILPNIARCQSARCAISSISSIHTRSSSPHPASISGPVRKSSRNGRYAALSPLASAHMACSRCVLPAFGAP